MNNLKCPKCNHQFTLKEDYEYGDCPNCNNASYYWDYVLDEETCEEYFATYYWDTEDRPESTFNYKNI